MRMIRVAVGMFVLYWCVFMPTFEHFMVRMQKQVTVKLCVRDNDMWYLKLESSTFHCDLISSNSYAMQSNINVVYIPTLQKCEDVAMFHIKIQHAMQCAFGFFYVVYVCCVAIHIIVMREFDPVSRVCCL